MISVTSPSRGTHATLYIFVVAKSLVSLIFVSWPGQIYAGVIGLGYCELVPIVGTKILVSSEIGAPLFFVFVSL